MNDEEFRAFLKGQIAKSKEMYAQKKFKNPEYGELCFTVAKLVESSDFGKKEAEATLDLGLDERVITHGLVHTDDFDGVILQLHGMANQCLNRYGSVSVAPYTSGIATRSATLHFKPNT